VSTSRQESDYLRLSHATAALLLLAGVAVVSEAVLAFAGGPGAAAAGAAAIVIVGLLVARYVGGADAIDASQRRRVRLVHQREPSLQGWAAAVEAAQHSAAGFERVLRPELERLYAVRLADRHGISLYHEPERAAALIGDDVFAWIDPRRPTYTGPVPPRLVLDRRARSVNVPPPVPDVLLRALVHRLETL
jgi:hypothetical protein